MIDKSITNVVRNTGKTGAVSQAINLAINNPTLWGFMRAGARKTMIKTAESSGIPWRQAVEELRNTPQVIFQTTERMLPFLASVVHGLEAAFKEQIAAGLFTMHELKGIGGVGIISTQTSPRPPPHSPTCIQSHFWLTLWLLAVGRHPIVAPGRQLISTCIVVSLLVTFESSLVTFKRATLTV